MAARQQGGAGWVARDLVGLEQEVERCPFCGAWVSDPCDRVPVDVCERALEAVAGRSDGVAG